ncbi:MAG TPA: hypothetical protein VFJ47_13095 [Terriglobales bacterium]|nr:hypothetical protein [Terriglobales bacterium]
MNAKTRALLRALQEQLCEELGEDVKTLLNKIDRMLAQNKKRKDIEKMMAGEITKYMRKRMQETRCIPT